jgi:hypothetical protein
LKSLVRATPGKAEVIRLSNFYVNETRRSDGVSLLHAAIDSAYSGSNRSWLISPKKVNVAPGHPPGAGLLAA